MSTVGGASLIPGLLPETLADLDTAWREREDEAGVLMTQGYHSTALALRMYALEIRVKTLICKQLKLNSLPRACKTHDLSEHILFTGMREELEDPTNVNIRQHWNLLEDFSKKRLNDFRYLPRRGLAATDLASLISALDDPQYGVLAWLSKHP
jgi:hypothetical protein